MDTPLVSVIMPVFNTHSAQLGEAVSSIKDQSFPKIELVVVDDGSSSVDTVHALESLTGVVLVRQENRGTGAALNAGVHVASGTLILPMGSDDVLAAGSITALVHALTSEDVVIAYPQVQMFGAESGQTYSLAEARLADIAGVNTIVGVALFRREHWELAGGFDEHNDCAEDWVLWATILGRTSGRAVRVDSALLHYRQHPISSRNMINRQSDRVDTARQRIADALPELLRDLYLGAGQTASEVFWARGFIDDARRWRRIQRFLQPILRLRALVRR